MNDKKIEKLIEAGKTDEEIVKIISEENSSEEDLSKYGIKKLEGGTLEDLKEKFPWILEANIEYAEIDISKDKLVWKDGIWDNGIWKDGIWEYGIWEDGIWEDGIWQYGPWKKGRDEEGNIKEDSPDNW